MTVEPAGKAPCGGAADDRTPERPIGIGEVAELLGVTPRTIRYYQELGLVACGSGRDKGEHRLYTEDDVARLADLIRLRDLLGLSLEELKALDRGRGGARRAARAAGPRSHDDAERATQILEKAIPHVRRQLELVHARRQTLDETEQQLASRLAELEASLAKLRQ